MFQKKLQRGVSDIVGNRKVGLAVRGYGSQSIEVKMFQNGV
jgi:hypothetical protein